MNGIHRLIEEKEAALRAQYAKAELMEEALEQVNREIDNLKIQIGTLKEALPLIEQEGANTNGHHKDPSPITHKEKRDNLQQYLKSAYKGRTYPDIIINLLLVNKAMSREELVQEMFVIPEGMMASDFKHTVASTLNRLKTRTGEIEYVYLNNERKYVLAANE